MKLLTPIILLVLSISLFFAYINPTYGKIQELKQQESQYDDALNNSRQLQGVRDKLLAKYRTFSTDDIDRLAKLLPDTVDNVRLIMDIANIASKYGITLKNVAVKDDAPAKGPAAPGQGTVGPDTKKYGSIVLDFGVSSSYENFRQFMMDLEDSLRIVDITSLTFRSSDADLYEYSVSIRTYWLK